MRPPKYKVLALDVDGTLLDREGNLRQSTVRALDRAAQLGIRAVLCTGRRHRKAVPVARALGLEGPLVCNSGALVKSFDGRSTIHRADLSPKVAEQVVGLVREHGASPLAFLDEGPEAPDFVTAESAPPCRYLADYLDKNQGHERIDPDWEATAGQAPMHHLCAFGTQRAMLAVEATVKGRLGGAVQTFVQKSPSYAGFAFEALAGGANKWTALLVLARRWGASPSEIVAIGDDLNDVPMIEGAGLGVAMGHAPPEVLAVADHVTADHDGDGVGTFIEQYLLA